jgi:molybdate transport system regulatory protein
MTNHSNQNTVPITYVAAELRLAGMLERRMIGLPRAMDKIGSINLAAKQMGSSYKGAGQIIERANHLAPRC